MGTCLIKDKVALRYIAKNVVDVDIAKMLKEIGYNGAIMAGYNGREILKYTTVKNAKSTTLYPAPTFDFLKTWLLEKYEIVVEEYYRNDFWYARSYSIYPQLDRAELKAVRENIVGRDRASILMHEFKRVLEFIKENYL